MECDCMKCRAKRKVVKYTLERDVLQSLLKEKENQINHWEGVYTHYGKDCPNK